MTAPADLEQGRRLARRRLAIFSFWFLIATAGLIVLSLILSPAREEIAQALSIASVIIGGLLATFTSIVLGYLGVSMVERAFGKKD